MSVNYRHAFHAGNFADVLKHALLVRLVRSMQRKETGFLFVDTHAGRGGYDLSVASAGDTRARTPEWPDGVGRLWDLDPVPPAVKDYVDLVRGYDRSRGNLTARLRFYPGSPRIARSLARPQDRMEFWEKHPAECAVLRDEFHAEPRTAVHEADGYGAMRACLPPAERRALVLIDPTFERQQEWADVSTSLDEGLSRFPSGTYAVWYPVSERARSDAFIDHLKAAAKPALACELGVDLGLRMTGCGVIIVNPPWQFDDEASALVAFLADELYRAQTAQGSVRWIVPR